MCVANIRNILFVHVLWAVIHQDLDKRHHGDEIITAASNESWQQQEACAETQNNQSGGASGR